MTYNEIKGKSVPIRMWSPVHRVESEALDQLKNVSALPWVFHHVAVMPDVHAGKGCTVGSVIATKDAVSPACVGVDIGCVDNETEFLTPSGWKRIDTYKRGDLVMNYDPKTGESRFFEPLAYIKEPCTAFWRIKTKYGVDQKISGDHKVLYTRYDRSYKFNQIQTIMADDLAEWHNNSANGFRGRFITTFDPVVGPGVDLTDDELRVSVMVAADAYVRNYVTGNCVLHLKKHRKIQRAKELLQAADIDFTERNEIDETVRISFSAPFLAENCKTLAFWEATQKQLRVIASEVLHWDGNYDESCYYTRNKESADFMSYCFAATGKRSVMRADAKDGGMDYRVFAHDNTMVGINGSPKTPITSEPSADGFKYCFTTMTGFWIMRRGGVIAATGNCGMAAVKTSLDMHKVERKLKDIYNRLEEVIPVGFNAHEDTVADERNTVGENVFHKAKALFEEFRNLDPHVKDLIGKAGKQLGTLGGGNHFIELCLDTENNVWLMLHSGSRNIGKELAEVHISKAKELTHNKLLPDRDLAVFLSGTPEMESYRRDLMWAQRYAALNREVMLRLYKNVLEEFWPGCKYEQEINCHHNYVEEEVHFGEQVFVTRKGAISAKQGQLGIIPGSMGTKSYIVQGLGNPDSFNSASHGAGRKMSRGKAKAKFTREDLIEQTEGIMCRKDSGVIDEIPGAYKKIEEVMANQSDLVSVVAELKQVLCVKG